eukprot:COSAG04_NODE_50_length_31170_cov_2.965080_14_plen_368_part_00
MLPALAAHLRTGDPSVAPCPTPLPTAATSSTPKKVRLALVGCGQICQTSHWPGIAAHAHPYIEVTAVVDTLEENAVTLAGLIEGSGVQASRPRVFTDLDEALAADGGALFDAVDVMLPHHLHRPVAEQCFAAGRHVCLEKPMAHQLEDAEAILRAAAAAESAYGCVFFMAEQSQFWPEVLCAKALIDSGAIGQLLAANCRMNSGSGAPSDEPPAPLPPHAAWRASRAQSGGGVIMDGGAHWIRPLRMIMGEIEEVTGQVRSEGVGDPRHEGEQFGRAMFRHVGVRRGHFLDRGCLSAWLTLGVGMAHAGADDAVGVELGCGGGGAGPLQLAIHGHAVSILSAHLLCHVLADSGGWPGARSGSAGTGL